MRNSDTEAIEFARTRRRAMNDAERKMWWILRNRELGFQFRRQSPVGPYCLDFYCVEAQVCVELDGDSHWAREARDMVRDNYLLSQGILTIRIANESMDGDEVGVRPYIQHICEKRVAELEKRKG